MVIKKIATQAQLLSVIQTQTEIAKLGLDINAVMTVVVDQVQQLTHASGAVVELAEGPDMVYRAVSGGASHLLGLRLQRENSLSGCCIAQQETLYCEDSELDDRVDREACRRVGLRSMIVVPLLHVNEPIGVLKIYSDRVQAFKPSDIHLVSLMTDLIAAAMYHATRFTHKELYKLATQDQLTGLANRALFVDCLRQATAKAQLENKAVTVFMLDMNGLKQINDQKGHRFGDAALKEIARRILDSTREQDVVARLGGDEFAVLMTSIQNRELAIDAMQRIIEACAEPFDFENQRLTVGISAGFSQYPEDATVLEKLLEVADLAMYQNKKQQQRILTN